MNFVVLKNNLKEGLSIISGALKENSNLPVLRNVLIETHNGKIRLSSTDLEIAITHFASAKILETGATTIPFGVLSHIVNNLLFERINIELIKTAVLISTDNYKAKITTTPKDEFPIIPEIQNRKQTFTFDTQQFIDALSSVVSACQVSDIRPELSGIFFSYKTNTIKMAATDSFRLAERTIEEKQFSVDGDEVLSCIIPLRTIHEVIRIFSGSKENKIHLVFENHQALFETEYTSIISRLIEGKFPSYELIIPQHFETEAEFEKENLISALKLSSSLSNKLHEVKFTTDQSMKSIRVFSASQEFGESEYMLPAKIKGQPTNITFNWRFVLDGLRNIKTEKVTIGLNGEEKPSMLRSSEDRLYFYIIMPIKSS
jgi:DNA polymerase-3 subunit beta